MKQTDSPAKIGVIGMGVMGTNLSANMEGRGARVALWNITFDETEAFVHREAGDNYIPCRTVASFVAALERPRTVVLMVTAGQAVDDTLEDLIPLLDEGDMVVDGGNAWFEDTRRRETALSRRGLHFIGMGVSGGAEGARIGPCLMPGGDAKAYARIAPLLLEIAAQTDQGPAVTHVGSDGAGHFVKMVHNGIEYADMQLIAETYDLLGRIGCRDAAAIGDIFSKWNSGPLASFLVELTARVLKVEDTETGQPLVELIMDKAGQKGTGQWTNQAALSLGVAVPTIAAAVDARILSVMKSTRVEAERRYRHEASLARPTLPHDFEQMIHQALLTAKVIAYAQGFFLIARAAEAYGWHIALEEIARIWRGGCIIRANLLDDIMAAYRDAPSLPHLLLDDHFTAVVRKNLDGLRRTVSMGTAHGIPLPAFSASLGYFDAFTTSRLPQNLIQAQRDAFGAHTYERIDKQAAGFVHTDWD